MNKKQIILDFGAVKLDAELFDSEIAKRFAENLPYTIRLEQWGNELYGSIGINLGEDNPVPEIPPGGLAYTHKGNYLCVFFGQIPAWPVEHIGQITGDQWQQLVENPSHNSLTLK